MYRRLIYRVLQSLFENSLGAMHAVEQRLAPNQLTGKEFYSFMFIFGIYINNMCTKRCCLVVQWLSTMLLKELNPGSTDCRFILSIFLVFRLNKLSKDQFTLFFNSQHYVLCNFSRFSLFFFAISVIFIFLFL